MPSFELVGDNVMAYPAGMDETPSDKWEHSAALAQIRGGRSMETVAREVGVNRVTWHKWERGDQRPSHDSLRAIVETFNVPPALVGYDPPQGWELVPADWIAAKFDELRAAQCEMMKFFVERADANRERMETLLAAIPEKQAETAATIHEHMDEIWKAALKRKQG